MDHEYVVMQGDKVISPVLDREGAFEYFCLQGASLKGDFRIVRVETEQA